MKEILQNNLWLHFTGVPKEDVIIFAGWFMVMLFAIIATLLIGIAIAMIFTDKQPKLDGIASMIALPLLPVMGIAFTVLYNITGTPDILVTIALSILESY